MKYAMMLSFA